MIHSFYYFIVFLYLINYYYFIKLVFHNIFFISLPKLEPNSSASWKRSLLKMHEMFDKCLMYSLMAVMACVSDWRMVPRLCSRLHIKDTVTSLRNCSSSPPHLAFWRYERHACVSFLHLVFKPMPLPCIWTVCVLLCNLERFYSSSCRRHGRESQNSCTVAEGKCQSSFTQQGQFQMCEYKI